MMMYPPVISSLAGWKIPCYEKRFLARNITEQNRPFSSTSCLITRGVMWWRHCHFYHTSLGMDSLYHDKNGDGWRVVYGIALPTSQIKGNWRKLTYKWLHMKVSMARFDYKVIMWFMKPRLLLQLRNTHVFSWGKKRESCGSCPIISVRIHIF